MRAMYCGAVATQLIVLNGGCGTGKARDRRCLQAVLPDPRLAPGVDTLDRADAHIPARVGSTDRVRARRRGDRRAGIPYAGGTSTHGRLAARSRARACSATSTTCAGTALWPRSSRTPGSVIPAQPRRIRQRRRAGHGGQFGHQPGQHRRAARGHPRRVPVQHLPAGPELPGVHGRRIDTGHCREQPGTRNPHSASPACTATHKAARPPSARLDHDVRTARQPSPADPPSTQSGPCHRQPTQR